MSVVLFLLAATSVGVIGPRLTKIAEGLGQRFGLGEALAGAILLGMTTSLPGIAAVATASLQGNADLAVATAFGGIIAQTSFLVVADAFHRRGNIEHDIHTPEVMMSGAVLIALIGMAIMAIAGPDWTFWNIHPATLLLPAAYLVGVHLVDESKDEPGWEVTRPRKQAKRDMADQVGARDASTFSLVGRFLLAAAVVSVAGWLLARTGSTIGHRIGLTDSLAGSLLVGQATSLPELVTSIAAVRLKAPTLAVANIVGGNTFDVLFIAVGDLFYRDGSIYGAVLDESIFLAGMAILATTVLVMGLIRREDYGILNIGSEGAAIFLIYVGGFGVLFIW